MTFCVPLISIFNYVNSIFFKFLKKINLQNVVISYHKIFHWTLMCSSEVDIFNGTKKLAKSHCNFFSCLFFMVQNDSQNDPISNGFIFK